MPPDCPHDEKVSPYVQSHILLFLFQSTVTQFGIISKSDKSILCHLLQVVDEDANHVAGLTPKHDYVTGVLYLSLIHLSKSWHPNLEARYKNLGISGNT